MLSILIFYGLNAFHAAKDVVMTFGLKVLRAVDYYVITPFVVLLSLFTTTSANAAIDTSAALATFGDVNTAIPVVGAAFLAALGVLAAWKLIRGAFA